MSRLILRYPQNEQKNNLNFQLPRYNEVKHRETAANICYAFRLQTNNFYAEQGGVSAICWGAENIWINEDRMAAHPLAEGLR